MLCNWPRDPNNELSPGHGWYCYDIELTDMMCHEAMDPVWSGCGHNYIIPDLCIEKCDNIINECKRLIKNVPNPAEFCNEHLTKCPYTCSEQGYGETREEMIERLNQEWGDELTWREIKGMAKYEWE